MTTTTLDTECPLSTDPRTVKSRAALISAMINHLDEHAAPPGISEVVARAGSSRPTFYQHFGDIPTLMHEAAMQRLDCVLRALSTDPADGTGNWADFARANFTTLFEHLAQHRDFYLAIVKGPSGVATIDRLIRILAERMHTVSPLRRPIEALVGADEAHRLAHFLAAGLTALAIDDLDARTPVDRMVRTTTVFLSVATSATSATPDSTKGQLS